MLPMEPWQEELVQPAAEQPRVRRRKDGTLMKGSVLNPSGHKVDARREFTNAFIRDLHEVWADKGKAALETLADFAPDKFAAVAVRLVHSDDRSAMEVASMYDQSLAHFAAKRLEQDRAESDAERLLR